jgi:uncharacterized membrane protein
MPMMRDFLPQLVLPAIVAVAVGIAAHFVTLYLTPYTVMSVVTSSAAGQVGWNSAFLPPRSSAQSRGVPRPSPDLLYSLCAYDLSQGQLHVTAPVPTETYWSVAIYADNTDNFFVVNDRQSGPLGLVDFALYLEGTRPPEGDLPKIKSPSRTGLVLFRTLISDEKKLPELENLRKETKCAIYVPEPPTGVVPTPQPKPELEQTKPPADEGTGQN